MGQPVQQVSIESKTYKPISSHLLLNWGSSTVPDWYKNNQLVWNPFYKVAIATNKLTTFELLQNKVNIPLFTSSMPEAQEWLDKGKVVFCRTKLNSHSGDGIVIASKVEDLVPAGLYTSYIKKRKEFRVHVAFNKVIDIQQKKIRTTDIKDKPNFAIRSYNNGWVFCREDIQEPIGLRESAIESVKALGLDFGAVDIVWNEKEDKCYVLEINTAPGLEGTTLDIYTKTFVNQFKSLQESS